jgi:acyl-CoA reductase-like NAD-dependent aldehyde dehydrogenase
MLDKTTTDWQALADQLNIESRGFKQSGNGRDKSIHAFHDYTELKTTWIEFD